MTHPAAPPEWLPPRFRLLKRLGAGGMGEVWLAEDRQRGQPLALKWLTLPDSPDDGTAREDRLRFKREFILLSKLDHPGIVKVHDSGEAGNHLYYTMDAVTGWPLHGYFSDGHWSGAGAPTPGWFKAPDGLERVWTLARELLGILDYLHGQGVVHRDLKPANLMVDESGRLRLIDFGLAKRAHLGADLTRTGQFVGTLKYVSPEQIRGLPLDGRADLYAVGVILYLLTTGEPPFDGALSAVLMKHLQEPPVPPGRHNPLLGAARQSVILRLLAKTPADRYAGAFDCARAMEQPELDPAATDPTLSTTLEFAAAPRTRVPLAAPYIGNAAAREAALAACRALAGGAGSALLATGPQGGGKSRLGEEIRALAPELALQVWRGASREAGGMPGELFQGVFTELAARLRVDPALIPRWLGADAGLLAGHFPALRGLPGIAERPESARLDPEGERGLLMAAVFTLFSRLAEALRLVLLLDDLQWADDLSLELAAHLIGNFTGGAAHAGGPAPRLMIYATCRNDGAGHSPALTRTLSRLRAGPLALIELAPLSPDECSRLIQSLLGLQAAPPDPFIERLHALTGGNPYYLTETLHALVGDGRLASSHGAGGWDFNRWLHEDRAGGAGMIALPDSLQTALQQRLAELAPGTRKALRIAAVIGRDVPFDWWLKTGGLDEDALLEAAESAVRHGLLEEAGGGGFRFLQDAARVALLGETLQVKRRRWHARMVGVLEAEPRGRERFLERLTEHALEGGLAAPALEHGHALAARMLQLYQTDSAARLLDRVAALHPESAPMAPERLLEHLQLRGQLLSLRNDAPPLIVAARRGIELAQRLGRPGNEHEFWRRLAYAENILADFPAGLIAAETAFNLATAAGDDLAEARALVERATALQGLGRNEAAQACYEDAYLRAAAHHQFALCGNIANSQGIATWESGDLSGALKLFDKALLYAEKGGSPIVTATARGNGAEIAIYLGRLGSAENSLLEALRINREIGLKTLMADNLNNLGQCRLLRGDFPGALQYLDDAFALARSLEDRYLEAFARLHRAGLFMGLADWPKAAAEAAASGQLFQSLKYPSGEAQARCLKAELLLREGRLPAALAEAGNAVRLARRDGGKSLLALSLSQEALARALNDVACDDGAFAEALRLAVEARHLPAELTVLLRHGRALAATGGTEAAGKLFGECAARADAAEFGALAGESRRLSESL